MKKFFVALVISLLWGCGEQNSTVTPQTGALLLGEKQTLKDIPCDSSSIGQMVYDADADEMYYCTGSTWHDLNGVDGEDGFDGKDGEDGHSKGCIVDSLADGFGLVCGKDSAFIPLPTSCKAELNDDSSTTIICGKDTSVVLNGKPGKESFCYTERVKEGLKVVCDGDSVGLVKDGVSCVAENIGSGVIQVRCGNSYEIVSLDTVYQEACGTKTYDRKSQFCSGGEVYELCGSKGYDPKRQYCADGEVQYLGTCDGYIKFRPAYEYCFRGEILKVDSCGASIYRPEIEYCVDGEVREKYPCDDKYYMPDFEYCGDGYTTVLPKDTCNGIFYHPLEHFCYKDSLYLRCTKSVYYDDLGEIYNPDEEFCVEGKVYKNCGTEKYSPSKFVCDYRDNTLYPYERFGGNYWMTKNLQYKPISGGSYCFNGKPEMCETYGRLYTWSAAVDATSASCSNSALCDEKAISYPRQGACPEGWYVPNKRDWVGLIDDTYSYYDGSSLRSKEGWLDVSSGVSGNGTNSSGFNVVPAGYAVPDYTVSYGKKGEKAFFWSLDQEDKTLAWSVEVNSLNEGVPVDKNPKKMGYSLRCVKKAY